MQIYKTSDLDQFSTMEGNRELSQPHIDKLVTSISEDNYLDTNPIIVTADKIVIDGQHRLEAAKQLGVPIYYVLTEGDLQTVQRLNTHAKQWTLGDFVESYIELGQGQYAALKDFKNKWGIGWSMAVTLLSAKADTSSNHPAVMIRDGSFKIKSVDQANQVMEWVDSCSEYADAVIRRNRSFISAIISVMESKKVSLQNLKHKLEVYAKPLSRYNNKSDYLRQLEMVINYKSHKEIRLF